VEFAAELALYHDGDTPYADLRANGRRETWPLTSRRASDYLRRLYWSARKRTLRAQALADARGVLIARALYDGAAHRVHLRVGAHAGKLYIDLGDEAWRALEVSPEGWRIVTEPPLRFWRPGAMLPLPEPDRGGSVEDLGRLANVGSEDDLRLLLAWVLGALSPAGPYPILNVTGEEGSAKTSTARLIRSFVDPCRVPIRAEPRDVGDLMVAARHGHVVALDNLSSLPTWLSDGLCRLATGVGLGKRELYTDAEEVLLEAIRPVILTGIEDVATRGDLLRRCLTVTLPPIPDEKRRTEAVQRALEDRLRPRILGVLLDAMAGALASEPVTEPLPSMADWYAWVARAEPALGWPRGTLRRIYAGVRESAAAAVLEVSPLAATLLALDLPWCGTHAELLDVLSRRVDEQTKRSPLWPRTARGLSGALKRLAPSLRAHELEIVRPPRGRDRRVTLHKVAAQPTEPSHSTTVPDDGSVGLDGSVGHPGTSTHDYGGLEEARGIVADAQELDAGLRLVGGSLIFRGDRLTDSVRARLRKHHAAVVELLARSEADA
jgi:hypothetical protein